MNACSRGGYGARDKSPRGDSWGSADRANLHVWDLRVAVRIVGDMVQGSSLVGFESEKPRKFRVKYNSFLIKNSNEMKNHHAIAQL